VSRIFFAPSQVTARLIGRHKKEKYSGSSTPRPVVLFLGKAARVQTPVRGLFQGQAERFSGVGTMLPRVDLGGSD